jgi:hypothetical protein
MGDEDAGRWIGEAAYLKRVRSGVGTGVRHDWSDQSTIAQGRGLGLNMDILTTSHDPAHGWRDPLPAHLDSDQTIALVFGASAYAQRPEVFADVMRALPRSHVLGCSTAGEILGRLVSDGSLIVSVVRFADTTVRMVSVSVVTPGDSLRPAPALVRQLEPSSPPHAGRRGVRRCLNLRVPLAARWSVGDPFVTGSFNRGHRCKWEIRRLAFAAASVAA